MNRSIDFRGHNLFPRNAEGTLHGVQCSIDRGYTPGRRIPAETRSVLTTSHHTGAGTFPCDGRHEMLECGSRLRCVTLTHAVKSRMG